MAVSDADLRFSIKADASQARGELGRFRRQVDDDVAGIRAAGGGALVPISSGAQAATGSFRNLRGELSLISPMLGRLSTFGGGGAMAGAFFLAAKEGVAYAEVLDKLSKSFAVFTGSEQAAAAHLKELHEFAARTPFEFEEIAEASQKFQNMGIAAKDVVPLLTAVGNAVARAGGGSAQIERVSKALSDVMARGKVSAQEMNQLANNLVDGWGVLEKALGKSRGELMEMAEQGDITAAQFVKAFREAHEGGDAMQRQMQTLSGAWSTLKDNAKLSLAEGFKPLHGALRDIAVELANTTQRGFSAADALKAAAAAAAEFGFSVGNVPSSAILAQMQAARHAGAPVDMGTDEGGQAAAQAAKFRDNFRAEQEKLAKELEKLAPGLDILSKLKVEVGTFGDKSNVTAVTEQFKRLREELAASGQAFSDEAAAKFDEWERESVRAAAQLDALEKRREVEEKARKEAERQSDILKRLSQDYAEASIRVTRHGQSVLELEAALYKLSIGYNTLSDANKLLAQDEINRIFSAKRELQRLEATDAVRKALNATIDEAQQAAKGEKTHVEQVTDALAAYVDAGGQADETTRRLAERALKFARNRDIIDGLNELAAAMERVAIAEPATPGVDLSKVKFQQAPGPGYGQAGPYVNPTEFTKEFGEPPAPTFDLWKESLNGLKGVASGVFGGISQGFGGMIQAFLMGEKGAAKSFGAIAKAAISSMAATAAVSALYELAQGLAWLFINPPKAAAHFSAAAVFGIVAGAAGIGAALMPGGSAPTGSAFGGGGPAFGGGFGSSNQDTGPRVVEQSRNTQQPQVIILRVESNDSHILNVLETDVRRNGPTRNLIIETAGA